MNNEYNMTTQGVTLLKKQNLPKEVPLAHSPVPGDLSAPGCLTGGDGGPWLRHCCW